MSKSKVEQAVEALVKGGSYSEATGEVMKLALERVNKEKSEALGKEIESVLKQTNAVIEDSVRQLRALRKREKVLQKLLKDAQVGMAHFQETGNPLPLLSALDMGWRANQFVNLIGVTPEDEDWKLPE